MQAMKEIKRDVYLNKIIDKGENGSIKILPKLNFIL